MGLKKRYVVWKVEKIYNDIEMRLHEWSEIKIPHPEKSKSKISIEEPKVVIQPLPKTDEEKMVANFMGAMEKYVPGFGQIFEAKSSSSGTAFGPPPKSLIDVVILIPLVDYKELGNPGVDAILYLDISPAVKKS